MAPVHPKLPTIEQLADVFRYALRGAESEWALLDDEIEFVRAYLDVERARFGSRLQVHVRLADDVRGARAPTMIVQTLVENAVKHGVAEVRGAAVVHVEAVREGSRLLVSVADNGPGFVEPPARAPVRPKAGGYGLANIRRRLEGYFGHGVDARRGHCLPHGFSRGGAGRLLGLRRHSSRPRAGPRQPMNGHLTLNRFEFGIARHDAPTASLGQRHTERVGK